MSTIPVLQSVLPIKWALMDQALGIDRTSDGHSLTKRWASTEQATGTHCPCGGHRVPKRWAIFGHLLQVGGFAIMHDASWLSCSNWMTFFMILLWYFYDTSCKIIQNVSFFYLIMYQLFVSVFSQQDDTLILFT